MVRCSQGAFNGALFGLALVAVTAQAQGVISPGQVLETVRPEQQIAPPPTVAPVISTDLPATTGLDPDAPRFNVEQLRIVGARAIDSAELQQLIADFAGKRYNLFELQAVLDRITTLYRERGFPVARAVLPAQKIENGVVTVEVIEGRIDQVVFSGNERYGPELLARWGAPLVDRDVRVDLLEERLLLINDLPGMTARAVLRPGERYGATATEVAVSEKPVEGRLSFNNYGREEVGEHRLDGAVQFNNPLGIGDQLALTASRSEDDLLALYGISYSLPVGVHGTRLAANYTYVDYDVGGELHELDLSGESHLGSIGLSHPLLRSRSENLYATLSVRSFAGEQYFGGDTLSRSEVTLVEAGLAWNQLHASGNASAAGIRVSTNLHDSDEGSADNAHLFKIDGEFTHLLRLSQSWELKLETAGMWSPDALVDAERFGLGGPSSVRGYPSAWSLGDRGLFASVEGRYRFRAAQVPMLFSVFADGGHIARKYPAVGTPKTADLSSVGMGLQFAPAPWLTAEVTGALPTGDMKSADGHEGGRVWFSLIGTF